MLSTLLALTLAFPQDPLAQEARIRSLEETVADLLEELDARDGSDGSDPDRLSVGGYGEFHFNDREGSGGSQVDLHRFVLYLGYAFDRDLSLHSELELEHAFVSDGDGELSVEQLYAEYALSDTLALRAGRVLAPLGITNQRHEPTTFNGVERPLFDQVVLPTTWSLDGLGLAGRPHEDVSFELYLSAGLDGSGFDDLSGIRGGRIKERPSFNEPALSGRVDWRPLDAAAGEGRDVSELRVGLAAWIGGLDNGDQGVDPGLDADLSVLALDAELSTGRVDWRAAFALLDVEGADDIFAATGEAVGSRIRGGYVEAAYHCLPESWRRGRLSAADATVFLRFEDVDTQADLPRGVSGTGDADRTQWVAGLGLWVTPQFVVKVDYELRDDAAGGAPDQFNLGFGWTLL